MGAGRWAGWGLCVLLAGGCASGEPGAGGSSQAQGEPLQSRDGRFHRCGKLDARVQKTVDLEPGETLCAGPDGRARVRYIYRVENNGRSALAGLRVFDDQGSGGRSALVCLAGDGICEYRPVTARNLESCSFILSPNDGWGCILTTSVAASEEPAHDRVALEGHDYCGNDLTAESTTEVEVRPEGSCGACQPGAAELQVGTTFPSPLCIAPGQTAQGEITFEVGNPGSGALQGVSLLDARAINYTTGGSQFLRLVVCPTGEGACEFRTASPENVAACSFDLAAGQQLSCRIPQTVTSNVGNFGENLALAASDGCGTAVSAEARTSVAVNQGCP